MDVIYAAALLLPLLVLLIYYGYLAHGLPGAVALSLAMMGPHYLLILLSDRRTALARQAAALRRLNSALERKQTQLADFVYTVTHDLKNPVNAMLLTADEALEREGEALGAESQRSLQEIVQLAGTTEGMITDLLGLFRITTAEEAVGEVSLERVVGAAVERLRAQIAAKRTRIEVGPLPTVRGQAGKLEHAIANLIANAVKYVPVGSGRVEVTAESRDGAVVLVVRDNGIGIEARYHESIFDLFTRVPPAGQLVGRRGAGHRCGARDREADRRGAGRAGLGRVGARTGQRIHGRAADDHAGGRAVRPTPRSQELLAGRQALVREQPGVDVGAPLVHGSRWRARAERRRPGSIEVLGADQRHRAGRDHDRLAARLDGLACGCEKEHAPDDLAGAVGLANHRTLKRFAVDPELEAIEQRRSGRAASPRRPTPDAGPGRLRSGPRGASPGGSW